MDILTSEIPAREFVEVRECSSCLHQLGSCCVCRRMPWLTLRLYGDGIQVDDSSEHVKISHLNVAAPVSDGDDLSLERRLAAASEGTSTSVLIHDLNLVCTRSF